MRPPITNHPWYRLATVGVCFAALALGLAAQLLSWEPLANAPGPGKKPAPAPAAPRTAAPAELRIFLAGLERYWTDRYRLTPTLRHLNCRFRYQLFGQACTKDVVVGKSTWLYYAPGLTPGQGSRVEDVRDRLSVLGGRIRAMGATFAFYLAPNAASIYPEYLPPSIDAEKVRLGSDRLHELLSSAASTVFVDVRPALRERKAQSEVYLRRDTHWNAVGAFAAYRAVGEKLAAALPAYARSLTPLTFADIGLRPDNSRKTGDLDRMLAMPGLFPLDLPVIVPPLPSQSRSGADRTPAGAGCLDYRTLVDRLGRDADFSGPAEAAETCIFHPEAENELTLYFFQDSFGAMQTLYFARHFRYTRTIPGNFEVIEKSLDSLGPKRPDVILLETVERFF